jgi:hypothetical protein
MIHSASAFDQPDQVLRDRRLSKAEKRTILSSWASDAHAVESQPWLRLIPGSGQPVPLATILSALCRLDDEDPPPKGGAAIRLPDRGRDPACVVAAAQQARMFRQRVGRRQNGVAGRSNNIRSVAVPGLRLENAVGAR